ncbi:MAG: hypothetical protein DRJ15_10205 [Bacteroidetes bacterium]|nr:MAG: hypothetical protein DRJ15_10205 [Bacteroidota bacterium]
MACQCASEYEAIRAEIEAQGQAQAAQLERIAVALELVGATLGDDLITSSVISNPRAFMTVEKFANQQKISIGKALKDLTERLKDDV